VLLVHDGKMFPVSEKEFFLVVKVTFYLINLFHCYFFTVTFMSNFVREYFLLLHEQ